MHSQFELARKATAQIQVPVPTENSIQPLEYIDLPDALAVLVRICGGGD
jgi:hypothetical protein